MGPPPGRHKPGEYDQAWHYLLGLAPTSRFSKKPFLQPGFAGKARSSRAPSRYDRPSDAEPHVNAWVVILTDDRALAAPPGYMNSLNGYGLGASCGILRITRASVDAYSRVVGRRS